MPVVTFTPSGASAEIPAGGSLLDAARLARVRLEAPCNGVGTCGKCKVKLDAAGYAQARIVATRNLSAEEVADGYVLLCSTLAEGDLEVTVPGASERGLRILEDGSRLDLPVQPAMRKRFDPERRCTIVSLGDRLLTEEGGDSTTRLYGVAVDIGTTTLVASLLDLGTGARVGSVSALNPQVTHAQDVLLRVQIASQPEGLARLHGELMGEIDRMIGLLATAARIPRRRIYEVVVAGNTCMMHIAANVSPEPLGRFPYTPALTGDEHHGAAALGLHIAPCGEVFFPPLISGFVGADITAGILATDLAQTDGVTLFVDIGTNGEMVLARDGGLQATSTAAGPAFEGMNIACGSGLLDAVAAMAVLGVIDRSGRFTREPGALSPALRARLRPRDGKTVFHLDGDVYLRQRDIRQVQLAKAAVRAGIDTMLRLNDLTPAGLDRALVAGSFGYHLTTRSLIDIGLFPAELEDRVTYVGNTARTGAEALLVNEEARAALLRVTRAVEPVELAMDPQFTELFVASMAFPVPAVAEIALA